MPHPFPAPGPAKARFQSSDFWKVFASFQGGETISCEKTKTTSNLIQTKNHLKIFLLRHVRPNREMLLLLPSKRWSQVHRDVSDRCWHRRDDLQHHHPPHQQPGETLRLSEDDLPPALSPITRRWAGGCPTTPGTWWARYSATPSSSSPTLPSSLEPQRKTGKVFSWFFFCKI